MGGKCLGFAVAVAGPQWPRKVGSSIKDHHGLAQPEQSPSKGRASRTAGVCASYGLTLDRLT
jgi:hypothetical protein